MNPVIETSVFSVVLSHYCLFKISYPSVWQLQYCLIGLMGRVFANGQGDLGSIPGHVIPKTLKMVLDTSLLNIQQYKVCIKGKVEQSRERSSALPYTSVLQLLKREPSGRPRLCSPTTKTIWSCVFCVFIQQHYGCNGFFGRPYIRSISSIFPPCMESNALEKSSNNSVASRFFA